MSLPVPSREALRALSRLCSNDGNKTRCLSSLTRKSVARRNCTAQRVFPQVDNLDRRYRSTTTTTVDAPESKTFANNPAKYDGQGSDVPQSTRQGATDPQTEGAGPSLPDISNYYTLFPKTLPSGPPGPQSNLPDSSVLTDGETPKPVFHINPRELRKEFLQLQSLHHPDKFPSGSVAHQRAYALSTLLNNAYKTLSDPLLRSQYLLQLQYDIDMTIEDNSAHKSDQEDLMIVLEAQEELEDVSDAEGDKAEKVVERLKEENSLRMRDTEKKIGEAFEKGNSEQARSEAVRLKYWHTLESSLKEWTPGRQLTLVH